MEDEWGHSLQSAQLRSEAKAWAPAMAAEVKPLLIITAWRVNERTSLPERQTANVEQRTLAPVRHPSSRRMATLPITSASSSTSALYFYPASCSSFLPIKTLPQDHSHLFLYHNITPYSSSEPCTRSVRRLSLEARESSRRKRRRRIHLRVQNRLKRKKYFTFSTREFETMIASFSRCLRFDALIPRGRRDLTMHPIHRPARDPRNSRHDEFQRQVCNLPASPNRQ